MADLRGWALAGAAAVVALAVVSEATAQSNEFAPLVDTINRLERQLRAVERTVYRGDAPPPQTGAPVSVENPTSSRGAAQLQVRLSEFEEEVRLLTGRVERLGFDVRQIAQRLDQLVADVDFRLRTLEQGGDGGATVPLAAADTPPNPVPDATLLGQPASVQVLGQLTESQLRAAGVQPVGAELAGPGPQEIASVPAGEAPVDPGDVTLPEGTPEEQYNFARSFLMQRDFERAEVALRTFVDDHRESALAGNAQYWLGETYYVRDDFLRAARAFAEGYQNFPNNSKAPDNLLKLGLSLANLERTDDACLTLAKLSTEYPEAPANIQQKAQREFGRLGCS